MKSSTYLPFLVTLTTANAAAILTASPLGDSNPGPYVVSAASPIPSDNLVDASTIVSANSAAAAAIQTAANFVVAPAANPGVPLNAAATSTYSVSPAAASSAAAELNAMMDEIMNSTYLYNETYPYYDSYYNGSYNGSHHHHHHHNSSYWNSTDFLNITEFYNTTNNLLEVVTVEANGTTTTQYYNATEGYGYGYGYGYGNYNGSGWGHHHNHTGRYNGTGWWTELMANETDTDMAATNTDTAATDTTTSASPLATGTRLPTTYDLTNKPGFTGPKKGKRASKLYGRWLSGVL